MVTIMWGEEGNISSYMVKYFLRAQAIYHLIPIHKSLSFLITSSNIFWYWVAELRKYSPLCGLRCDPCTFTIVTHVENKTIRKVFYKQKENPVKSDWVKLVEEAFWYIWEEIDDEKIEKNPKNKSKEWKKLHLKAT